MPRGSSQGGAPRDIGKPLETSFNSLSAITKAQPDLGCQQAFVKLLAANQDNDKSQIFVGLSRAVMDLSPGNIRAVTPEQKFKKSRSEFGRNIPESLIDLS